MILRQSFQKSIGLSVNSPKRSATGILIFYPPNNFFQISIIFSPFWSKEIETQCLSNFPKVPTVSRRARLRIPELWLAKPYE